MQIRQLCEVSDNGIVIDLLRTKNEKNGYLVPVYEAEKYRDMDLLYCEFRDNKREWEILFQLKIE